MSELFGLAFLTVGRRWRRTIFTGVALALGIGSVVALLGIAQSSAAQTVSRLSDLDPNSIGVTIAANAWTRSDSELTDLVSAIPAVTNIGTFTVLGADGPTVEAGKLVGDQLLVAPTIVATESGLHARGVEVLEGGYVDDQLAQRDPSTISIGYALAKRLDVSLEPGANLVTLNGSIVVVTALLKDGGKNSLVSTSLVLGPAVAARLDLLPTNQSVVVKVEPNTANSVAAALPLALAPLEPKSIDLSVPPSTENLRNQLAADLNGLVLIIALVTIATSLFGILNTMQTAVFERRSEIGILKAMGMSSARIGGLFLFESAIIGTGAGLAGFVAGVLIAGAVTYFAGWQFYLPAISLISPLLGLGVGVLAGSLPARRASRVSASTLIRAV